MGDSPRRINRVVPIIVSRLLTSGGPQPNIDGIPMALQGDAAGNLWVRTSQGGVATLDGRNDTDNQAPVAAGVVPNNSSLYGFDAAGVNWDRVRVVPDNADALAASALGVLSVAAKRFGWNGAAWDRNYNASAANLATFSSLGAALTTLPGQWSAFNAPAVNTQATCTRAAAAGLRNICTTIEANLSAVAALATMTLNLRDGASGAGTILWSTYLGPMLGATSIQIFLPGLNIPGTVNTAMTLEFLAAPGATNFESVAMTGYQAP